MKSNKARKEREIRELLRKLELSKLELKRIGGGSITIVKTGPMKNYIGRELG